MNMSSSEPATTVLYYTSTNPPHPVPLTHLYHATASRNLSTSLPTTPATSSTDVDSAYCPQCLTSWDGSSAFTTAKGRCMKIVDNECLVGCVSCPECSGVLSISVLDRGCVDADTVKLSLNDANVAYTHLCVYKCGYCHWDSTECGIYQIYDNEQEVEASEKMKVATTQLQKKLTEKLEMKDETFVFQRMMSSWADEMDNWQKTRRKNSLLTKGTIGMSIANNLNVAEEKKTSGTWSVENLEDAMRQRRERMAEKVTQSITVKDLNIGKLSIKDDVILHDIEQVLTKEVGERSRQQVVSTGMSTMQEMLPIPLALRVRTVRRCLKELESGRPGILVKPKVNPLEGDTSLRYGHGQWFKKDSSAIHTVPRVRTQNYKYNPTTNQYSLLLSLKNPTLGPVRLRLHSNFGESVKFPSSCEAILDSMTLSSQVVSVIPPASADGMEFFKLESVEDAILDIGKGSTMGSGEDWGDGSIDWSAENTCKLMSLTNDTALVQYTTARLETVSNYGEYIAAPLVLEIEIGEDSWESSLIKAKETEDGTNDSVSFTILPVWKKIGA